MNTSALMYENYIYNFDKRYNNKNPKRFTCNAKSSKYKCPVTAWRSNDGTVRIQGVHYHPIPTGQYRAPAISEIKKQSQLTDASADEIVNNVFITHHNAALHVRAETARQHVYRERRRYRPSLPQSFDELGTVLSNYGNVQNIYQGVINGTDGSIGYIFGSNSMIHNLTRASEIHIDGTFQSTPHRPRADQLIIVLMRHVGIGIPILFILSNRRTQKIYIEIWKWLLRKLPGLSNSLKYVISDYEIALMTSIRTAMPWVEHRGCWFHFARAVTKKWNHLRLPQNDESCYLLHLAWALPLLPANYFEDAINYMNDLSTDLQNANQKYTDFIEYLRRYWEPKADVVSVFGTAWRTNNIAEEFNRHLVNKMGGKHPSLYKFLGRLNIIICNSEIQYEKITNGTHKMSCSRWIQYTINLYIANIQEALRMGRYTLSQFLWAAVRRTKIRYELRNAVR